MKDAITYVGIDAHKKDLFIAMLVGDSQTPATWTVPNESHAVKRLVRKLERDAAGPVRVYSVACPHQPRRIRFDGADGRMRRLAGNATMCLM
jgi:hypothetical protein